MSIGLMAQIAALREERAEMRARAEAAEAKAAALLVEAMALVEKAPDDFASRYKSLHNRKRVDTDYVDRAVRKALLIMAEDLLAALRDAGTLRDQTGNVETHVETGGSD
jgi:hypothetical protein